MRRIDFIKDALVASCDGCIVWPFAVRKSSGYGAFNVKTAGATKNYDIHRYVCEAAYGAPPSPHHVAAHACGNRLCCNLRHLRWATQLENMADSKGHGTLRGGGRWRQKMFAAQVAHVRSSANSLVKLGAHFGMDPAYIGRIRRGKAHARA